MIEIHENAELHMITQRTSSDLNGKHASIAPNAGLSAVSCGFLIGKELYYGKKIAILGIAQRKDPVVAK